MSVKTMAIIAMSNIAVTVQVHRGLRSVGQILVVTVESMVKSRMKKYQTGRRIDHILLKITKI